MAFCENCGKELSPGSAFCEQCGTKLDARLFRESASGKRKKQTRIQAVYCEECGTKLVPGAFYCEECGTPVPVTEEIPEKRNWDSLSPKDLNYGLFCMVAMVDRGALTPNEWRQMFNLAPVEGGDKPIRRLDTAPTDDNSGNDDDDSQKGNEDGKEN